jgi:hypothetical protein
LTSQKILRENSIDRLMRRPNVELLSDRVLGTAHYGDVSVPQPFLHLRAREQLQTALKRRDGFVMPGWPYADE